MDTLAVSAATANSNTPQRRGMDDFASEDFFKLLITELQQQDPFKPSDTGTMIEQVSQIRSIELSGNLTDVLGQLTHQQHTAGTSELIGKYIVARPEGESGEVQEIEGVVTGVRFDTDGSALLELDTGQVVRAEDVVHVTTVENAGMASAGNAGNTATGKSDQPATSGATAKTGQRALPKQAGPLSWLERLFQK